MTSSTKGKVAVALSGGVDSSVALGLLAEQGYEVIGVTMQLVDCQDSTGVKVCCGAEAIAAARKVCRHLGVEHRVLDCRERFSKTILQAAWQEYEKGRTPSPCITCNSTIKFGFLLEEALSWNFQWVATGHHAQIGKDEDGQATLIKGEDSNKDQSYFLFALSAHKLAHILFPVGSMTKSQVRQEARRMKLPTAERIESTDACFQREGESFAESLMKRFKGKVTAGPFIGDDGNSLGRHRGLHNFTIGQRRGLGVDLGYRLWVKSIDPNGAVALTKEEENLFGKKLIASDFAWTGKEDGWQPPSPFSCTAKIRYRHEPAKALVTMLADGRAEVCFEQKQRAITPGQAVVFYDDRRVIGGGWIEGDTFGS